MSKRKNYQGGWAQPGNARKVHFFSADGRSLCKRWLYLGKTYSELPDLEITCSICEKKRQSPFEKYCDTIL
ncbi:hypothetical protein goonie_84 [Pseudomonas phage goonie]|uniref:Uncharacterized protein n=1 Tax=Pseudomonas phage goonie TaxID=2719837 RepID=A0A6H2A8B7_9CAUD|nr:hypothetical protein goonie_84 [Pseudomonas phage goonie]